MDKRVYSAHAGTHINVKKKGLISCLCVRTRLDACMLAMESLGHVNGGALAAHEDVDHVPAGQHRRRGCFSFAAPPPSGRLGAPRSSSRGGRG